MYTLFCSLPLRRLIIEQGLAFGIAFLIAETFYKFHSFTLECLAFLATWFVLDFLTQIVRRWLAPSTAVRDG
jgi:antibiotic biosynthesis monooxygenase (ABM) superfamily enzyme